MTMEQQVCSIEQMEALKELGVYTNHASMCYFTEKDKNGIENTFLTTRRTESFGICNPTFTVIDMLDRMPEMIIKNDKSYFITVDKFSCGYYCMQEDGSAYYIYDTVTKDGKYGSWILDAVYGTFLQLAQDGKL